MVGATGHTSSSRGREEEREAGGATLREVGGDKINSVIQDY